MEGGRAGDVGTQEEKRCFANGLMAGSWKTQKGAGVYLVKEVRGKEKKKIEKARIPIDKKTYHI